MISNNTYTQTIPYFYIIQNKITKKLYAGSKWECKCNPNTFMTKDGYTTSSPEINFLIKTKGLDTFEIIRIDTNCDGLHVKDYETLFLQTLDCAKLENWYNQHNNTGIQFGTKNFLNSMLNKHGVHHSSKIPGTKEKMLNTRKQKYNGNFCSDIELKDRSTRILGNRNPCYGFSGDKK